MPTNSSKTINNLIQNSLLCVCGCLCVRKVKAPGQNNSRRFTGTYSSLLLQHLRFLGSPELKIRCLLDVKIDGLIS